MLFEAIFKQTLVIPSADSFGPPPPGDVIICLAAMQTAVAARAPPSGGAEGCDSGGGGGSEVVSLAVRARLQQVMLYVPTFGEGPLGVTR